MSTRSQPTKTFRHAPRSGTKVGEAYERLRRLIIEGRYAPGQRLSQRELAEAVQVGRTPLREAIHMLEADGYLVSEANRGVTVAPASLDDAEQLYAIRLLVEPAIVSSYLSEFIDDDFTRMREHLDGMRGSLDRIPDFQRAHLDYHLVAIERYNQPLIGGLVLDLYRRVARHQNVHMGGPRVPEEILAIDEALFDAMFVQDDAAVRRILEFHLVESAIGLILDVDPDHRFTSLRKAAAASGLEIAWTSDSRLVRPASVRWLNPGLVPGFVTSTLYTTTQPIAEARSR